MKQVCNIEWNVHLFNGLSIRMKEEVFNFLELYQNFKKDLQIEIRLDILGKIMRKVTYYEYNHELQHHWCLMKRLIFLTLKMSLIEVSRRRRKGIMEFIKAIKIG